MFYRTIRYQLIQFYVETPYVLLLPLIQSFGSLYFFCLFKCIHLGCHGARALIKSRMFTHTCTVLSLSLSIPPSLSITHTRARVRARTQGYGQRGNDSNLGWQMKLNYEAFGSNVQLFPMPSLLLLHFQSLGTLYVLTSVYNKVFSYQFSLCLSYCLHNSASNSIYCAFNINVFTYKFGYNIQDLIVIIFSLPFVDQNCNTLQREANAGKLCVLMQMFFREF